MQNGINNLTMEVDSQVITTMIRNKDTNNRKLKHMITNIIITTIGEADVQIINHCFHEANQVANFLASMATISGHMYFSSKLTKRS